MPTLIAAFLFLLPLVVMGGNDDMAVLPQTTWLQVGAALLLTVRLIRGGTFRPLVPSTIWIPSVAFLGWSSLSLLEATDLFAAKRVLFRWLAAAGFAVLVASFIRSERHARLSLAALYWASVVVSVIGLLQHLGGWAAIPQAFPPAGTLGNKNVAAGFVATMMPSGFAALAAATTGATWPAIFMGVGAAFVFHTKCRAAMLVLLLQLAIALFVKFRQGPLMPLVRKRGQALCAGGGIFLLLISISPFGSDSNQGSAYDLIRGTARPILEFVGANPASAEDASASVRPFENRAERSISIRFGVWANTLAMIRVAPIRGVGIGNFQTHYPPFAGSEAPDGTQIDQRVESAHNDYLQIASELGLVGAALLGWLLLAILLTIVRSAFAVRGPLDGLVASCGLGLLGILVLATVSPVLDQPVFLAAGATFLGVTIGRAFQAADLPELAEVQSRSPLRYGFALAGALVCLGTASSSGFAQISADRHVLTMAVAQANDDWSTVAREGLVARRLDPGRTDPRFSTASAMLRLGRKKDAALLLEELVAAAPYNANAIGNLGLAYMALQDRTRAARCFERVLRLRPSDRIAEEALQRLAGPAGPEETP